VDYRVTVRADWPKVEDRIDDIGLSNSGKRHRMVYVNEPLADSAIYTCKIEPAGKAAGTVVLDCFGPCGGVALIAIDQDARGSSFNMRFVLANFVRKRPRVALADDGKTTRLKNAKALGLEPTLEVVRSERLSRQFASRESNNRLWRVTLPLKQHVVTSRWAEGVNRSPSKLTYRLNDVLARNSGRDVARHGAKLRSIADDAACEGQLLSFILPSTLPYSHRFARISYVIYATH
jgi:hypothetical protein